MNVIKKARQRVTGLVCAAAALIAGGSWTDPGLAAQSPAAGPAPQVIEVQVVDRDGQPIPAITADKFNVEVGGRRRRVVDARVIDSTARETSGPLEGRSVYFLAVDALTFGPNATNGAMAGITAFVQTLPAGSLVGLVTFPQGPSVELTTDHAVIVSALSGISGQRAPLRSGTFGLGVSAVVDYLSSPNRTEAARAYCGETLSEDSACPQILEQEASAMVDGMETQARSSLGMLSDFATRVGQIPGRKVVVLVSAGMAIAERSGARPDVGDLPTQLAEAVTRSDITFYTLLLDRLQDVDRAENARQASNPARDREQLGRWLDQFSTANGGALVRVQSGQSGEAYGRIVRETTSYYQLTLEPAAGGDATSDRPQRLRVRVDQRGATVRARTLVK
jgi:VWFA-related protein